tara:strand:- start:10601 stop:11527 length:927 start_codon:yes stop_codon:yes gene_type:complete
MFSVVFPGQGSQKLGMAKEFFDKFELVKKLFHEADEILNLPISRIIFEGPESELNLTENTQPAIFLTSYSIFKVTQNEFGLNLKDAKFIAGHSLGEYSALCCYEALSFEETLKALKKRGKFMQQAIYPNEGGMLAVLGSEIKIIEDIIKTKHNNCFIANDNSPQQIVISGLKKNLDLLSNDLNKSKIKNIKLNVSAPFHCNLMKNATENMREEINNLNFKKLKNPIISNYSATPSLYGDDIKKLLVLQIEGRVRWLESIEFMINQGTKNFIEIGPGKVLSGLVKRINKNVNMVSINSEDDIKKIDLNV